MAHERIADESSSCPYCQDARKGADEGSGWRESEGERGVVAWSNWTRSSCPKSIMVTPRGLQKRVGDCPLEL
jgi:hypothetical protein